MFENAIREAQQYTRPLQILARTFGSRNLDKNSATFMAVNSEGWALTCRHVTDVMLEERAINSRYASYRAELASATANKAERRRAEKKFGFDRTQLCELRTRTAGLGRGPMELHVVPHPQFDVALVRFPPFDSVSAFPRFADCDGPVAPGKLLCRLGFPLPTFTNYTFNAAADQIEWLDEMDCATPPFPLEGMVTREIVNESNISFAFELSTPGISGHSGGPVFDASGVVWGMQYATAPLDLGFSISIDGVPQRSILHVGQCIQVAVLTEFMSDIGVKFATA